MAEESMLIPQRLRRGDTIGIVSPSGAVRKEVKPQLKKGLGFLRNSGFKVQLGKNALKIEDRSAGTPEQRAEDINSMFSNDEIDAIICSQGGGTANTCLPLIDFDLIRKNPKIFLGISDITVLLNAFYAKTGLVTFHGNDVMFGFGRKFTRYDKDEFVDRLMLGVIGKNKEEFQVANY
jgi:muramoyltetrapeptide carboxypeptidase